MPKDDVLYEIAQTDAWKQLIRLIKDIRDACENELIRVACKKDARLDEIKYAAGRIDAVELVLQELGGKV